MAFKQLLAAVSVALLAQGTSLIVPHRTLHEVHAIFSFLGAALNKRVTCSTGQSVSDEACCAWFPVLEDIQQNLFNGGQCNAEAHESLRLSVPTINQVFPGCADQKSTIASSTMVLPFHPCSNRRASSGKPCFNLKIFNAQHI